MSACYQPSNGNFSSCARAFRTLWLDIVTKKFHIFFQRISQSLGASIFWPSAADRNWPGFSRRKKRNRPLNQRPPWVEGFARWVAAPPTLQTSSRPPRYELRWLIWRDSNQRIIEDSATCVRVSVCVHMWVQVRVTGWVSVVVWMLGWVSVSEWDSWYERKMLN